MSLTSKAGLHTGAGIHEWAGLQGSAGLHDPAGGSGYTMTNADAIAYVAARETAGATYTDAAKEGADTFFEAGWHNSHGLSKLFLFTQGVAAVNAINLIDLTSGTFVGGIDHTAEPGSAKGDGSTGYFEIDDRANSIIDSNDFCIGALIKTRPTSTFKSIIGSGSGGSNLGIQSGSSLSRVEAGGLSSTTFFNIVDGMLDSSLLHLDLIDTGTDDRRLIQRTSGENTTIGTNTLTGGGNAGMARISAFARAGANLFSDAALGAVWAGESMGETTAGNFMAAVQALWEAETGLTL